MKDTTSNKTFTTDNTFSPWTIDSIHKDLKGIRCEINHYRKDQEQDKSSVSNDTVFTVVVTLSIFVIGIIIDRLLKYFERIKKEEELRAFFEYHLLRTNDKMVPKLKEAYENYSKDTTIDTGITSTPPKVLSSDFQRLIHTNFEGLFKAYTSKEVLSKVLSNIELIDKVQIEVNNFHDRVYANTGEIRDELEKHSDIYLGLLSAYVKKEKSTNANYANSETYKLISASIKTYYTEIAGTRQLERFYQDIIRAIQKHIVDNGEYLTHPILEEVAENGRKLSHIVSKLQQRTKEIVDQYKVFSGHMDDANKSLTTLTKELK